MNAADIADTARRIRCYLDEHPNAADTVEGVAVCWVSGNTSEEFLITVHCAIGTLVVDGQMAKRVLVDGTVIYERASPRSGSSSNR